jgi:hypothetical protein
MSVDGLPIAGDDLTAIALALERKVQFTVDRKLYPKIRTVAD